MFRAKNDEAVGEDADDRDQLLVAFRIATSKTAPRREHCVHPCEKSIQRFEDQIRRLSRRKAPITTRLLIQQILHIPRQYLTRPANPGSTASPTNVRPLFSQL
jgi:hypothetical protein